ncbi:conserved hypothetical protein [Mycobacterium tuberculosis T92]|nr:conserved hypothetical protein [Mycobacterium tuberculosis T92]
MEAALAIATLVLVLVLCLAGVTAVSMQVRCIDAAREAARLAARGDVRSETNHDPCIAPRCVAGPGDGNENFVVVTVKRKVKHTASRVEYCICYFSLTSSVARRERGV